MSKPNTRLGSSLLKRCETREHTDRTDLPPGVGKLKGVPQSSGVFIFNLLTLPSSFQIRTSEIEDLLEKLPSVFRQDLMGVGASLEKRWKFVGFDSSV